DLVCVSPPPRKATRSASLLGSVLRRFLRANRFPLRLKTLSVSLYHAATTVPVPLSQNRLWTAAANACIFILKKSAKAVDLTSQLRNAHTGGRRAAFFLRKEGPAMRFPMTRFLAALIALCALTRAASAETQDCKTLTDPA